MWNFPLLSRTSRALANFKRPADEVARISARQDFADQCVDRVFLKPLEPRKAGDGRDRAVHKKIDTVARSPFGNSCMEAFACFDQRGKDLDSAAAGESPNGSGDGRKRLLFDWDTAVRTMLRAEFCKEEPKEMIDFGDGGDGRLAAAAGYSLFDRDAGRQAFDRIHIRLFELFHKLPCIRRHTVQKRRWPSANKMSKASVDLPDPLSPVITTIFSGGCQAPHS